MVRNARRRALAKGLPFDITADDIEIPERCPVLGIPLVPAKGVRGGSPASPSLDRIVPERGYVPGNIMVISNRANSIKQNASPYELYQVARFYSELASSHPELLAIETVPQEDNDEP